jgi:D-sedoheptulose 7-phosphate isomerase
MPSSFDLAPGRMQREDHAHQAILEVTKTIAKLDALELDLVAEMIANTLIEQKKVMILGNGGSCATASHFATDLTLMAHAARLRVSISALHDSSSLMSAMANDYGFAESGAALVETMGSSGDLLVIFSCSGRSANLVKAAHAAARLGVPTILVSSRLAPSDFRAGQRIIVETENYSVIEAVHSTVAHIVVDLLRIRFGVESPRHPRLTSCAMAANED